MKSSYALCVNATCLYDSGGDTKSSTTVSPLPRLSNRAARRFSGGTGGGMAASSQFVVPSSSILLCQHINEGCFESMDPHR